MKRALKGIFMSIAAFVLCNAAYAQINCKIDCIQISEIEYLIIVKNNTNKKLFLPLDPVLQKANDTLFAGGRFSYLHHSSTVYGYKINGVSFETNVQLDGYIKPDTIYRQAFGPMPNFAVPSLLFELNPQKTFCYKVFTSDFRPSSVVALSIFSKNSTDEKFVQIVSGRIIQALTKN